MNQSRLLQSLIKRAALCGLLCLSLSAGAGEIQDANKLFQDGQLQQSLNKVNAILASKPKDMQARYLKGLILIEMDRTNDAILVFQALTNDYPNTPEPYNNLGVLYASLKQYDKAEMQFQAAIRLRPDYAAAHDNLGDLHAKMAGQSYTQAAKLNPKDSAQQAKQQQALALAGENKSTPLTTVVTPVPTKATPAPAPAKPTVAPAPVPVAAKPATAAPGKAAPADKFDSNVVLKSINDWADAWSAQDSAKYLSFYSRDFELPHGATRAQWEASRKKSINKPSFIHVSVDEPNITPIDSSHVSVSFKQTYLTNRSKDATSKTLVLVKTGNNWLIQKEEYGSQIAKTPAKAEPTKVAVAPATPAPIAAVKATPPAATAATTVTTSATPAPVVAAAPAKTAAPTPSKTAATGKFDSDAVQAAVNEWAAAWSARNTKRYLAHYADDFRTPGGIKRSKWEDSRRQRLGSEKSIHVSLDDLQVAQLDDTHASVSFKQTYATKHRKDVSDKTLVLVRSGNAWLIQKEKIGRTEVESARVESTPVKAVQAAPAPVATTPAAPVAASEKPAATKLTASDKFDSAAVENSIKRWAAAWSSRNANNYLSFYANDFKPSNGLSHAKWQDSRRKRIKSEKSIQVSLADVQIEQIDKNHASASFTQTYRTKHRKDVSEKTLVLVKSGSNWLIQKEKSSHASDEDSAADTADTKVKADTPVAAAPAATAETDPTKPAAGEKFDSHAVLDVVNSWAAAWSSKHADDYLSFYADDFALPKGTNRSDWEAQRSQRIKDQKFIRVIVRKASVSKIDDSHARVTFKQVYSSDRHRDTSSKTLVLVHSGGDWLIQQESGE
ncbi:MAG: tetratricopeptide repeat protein [Nitrosomonadales bacterium]|nr:tetratricopeptide repeat protein [Nitrosomonadales bacterium]